jgi:hypothetical protein
MFHSSAFFLIPLFSGAPRNNPKVCAYSPRTTRYAAASSEEIDHGLLQRSVATTMQGEGPCRSDLAGTCTDRWSDGESIEGPPSAGGASGTAAVPGSRRWARPAAPSSRPSAGASSGRGAGQSPEKSFLASAWASAAVVVDGDATAPPAAGKVPHACPRRGKPGDELRTDS